MIQLNQYILEKLHLTKDINMSLSYPVLIQFYADWKDTGNLRDEIKSSMSLLLRFI